MKKMKKINPALYQHLALGLIVLVFVYWFYHFYVVYSDYRAEREIKPGTGAAGTANQNESEDLPVTPPSFYTIPPNGNATLDIFSFAEKKNDGSDPAGGEIDKPSDYTILGVVKRDRLYLAVRIHADNKLLFVPQGAAINGNYRVQELKAFSVVVIDREGVSHTYKIFQRQDIKELHDDEKKN